MWPSAPHAIKRISGLNSLNFCMNTNVPWNSALSPIPSCWFGCDAYSGKLKTFFSGMSAKPVPGKIPYWWIEKVSTSGLSAVKFSVPSPWWASISRIATFFPWSFVAISAASAKSAKTQKPDEWSYCAWCFAPGKWMAVLHSPFRSRSRAFKVPPANNAASSARSGRAPLHSPDSKSWVTCFTYSGEWTLQSSSKVATLGWIWISGDFLALNSCEVSSNAFGNLRPWVGWVGSNIQPAYLSLWIMYVVFAVGLLNLRSRQYRYLTNL